MSERSVMAFRRPERRDRVLHLTLAIDPLLALGARGDPVSVLEGCPRWLILRSDGCSHDC